MSAACATSAHCIGNATELIQWGKQDAAHLGGTRDPMVVAWPKHVQPSDEMRSQFTHVIDVGPTILEAAGIPAPEQVDGIELIGLWCERFGDVHGVS